MVYRGVESGNVEAVFKAATPEAAARPYTTGLEGSALGGGAPELLAVVLDECLVACSYRCCAFSAQQCALQPVVGNMRM